MELIAATNQGTADDAAVSGIDSDLVTDGLDYASAFSGRPASTAVLA